MYRINYRNLAIITLVLFGLFIFYKDPSWVVELLYPDHFSDYAKPTDSLVFVICVLGVIGGIILVLVDSRNRPSR